MLVHNYSGTEAATLAAKKLADWIVNNPDEAKDNAVKVVKLFTDSPCADSGVNCGVPPGLGFLKGSSSKHQVTRGVLSNSPTIFNGITVNASAEIAPHFKNSKLTKGCAGEIQSHHIVELRHLENFGMDKQKAPVVILTREVHQKLSNEFETALPKGAAYKKSEVLAAYEKVYKNYPREWLDAAKSHLGK